LRTLILQARAAAINDADAVPAPSRRLDIESDEFVMDCGGGKKVQQESRQEQNRL